MVVVTDDGTSSHVRALHPEQNCVAWMRNANQNFTSPGQTVFDHCSGTFAKGKACISLPRHGFLR